MILPALLTEAPAYTLPPELLAKAKAIAHLATALYFGGTAWILLVLGLLLRWRVGARVAGWAARCTDRKGGGAFAGRPVLAGLLVAPAWLLLLALLALPGGLLGHTVALRFGLSVEHWPAWWVDWCKSQAISLALGTLVVGGVFAALRRGRLWWVWCWAVLQPFVVLGVFLAPVVVDPLFNHFTPLASQDPALAARLEQLAQMGGLHIPESRMFVSDASRRSTGVNAYVTGIGSSARVVVWDTTLQKLPPEEILAVYAHEQGHYVLHHIWKGIAFSAALTLVLFALVARVYEAAAWRGADRWRIASPGDWSALPLLLGLVTLTGFLAAPAANAFSRGEEHAADVYGEHLLARVLPNAAAVYVDNFNRMGRLSFVDPTPNRFVVWWTYTHPPIGDRAEEARRMEKPVGSL